MILTLQPGTWNSLRWIEQSGDWVEGIHMIADTHLTLASIVSIIDDALPKYVPCSLYMFVSEASLWTLVYKSVCGET
jgi:hypothetical protein